MHLNKLSLTNFRSFKSGSITLQPDLTILVGENNSGKSNAVDALRLLTPSLNGRREIYCQPTDIRFGAMGGFKLTVDYANLNAAQQGRLISACKDTTMSSAHFGIIYKENPSSTHQRPKLWAGSYGRVPEAGCHEMIRHVYLPALRDAKYALASGNPTRIYALLKHFLGDGDETSIVSDFARQNDHEILGKIVESVDSGLESLTGGVRQQAASLGFSSNERLFDIAKDLRFSLADNGIAPEDLSYSGHGYANLLYIASIAVELEHVNDADLTLFLVEEPEAHLHPQLQAAVLAFLKSQATKSRAQTREDGGPAGEIQVVVATHSPNLTAGVPSENIVFIRSVPFETHSVPEPEQNETTPQPVAGVVEVADKTPFRRESRSISLASLVPDGKQRRKIDRYVDVTKAAFLFGGRVLLVEGIAEAILLPVFAEYLILKGDESALRRFRSTTFVPIDGVDFLPYLDLLIKKENGIRIADKIVIITDGDSPKENKQGLSPGEQRKFEYDALAESYDAKDIYNTYINKYSLETELLNSGNGRVLKNAYLTLHEKSENKWNEAVAKTGDDRAIAIHEIFKDTRKGDFAQLIAEQIEDGYPFTIPSYLDSAVKEISAE